MKEKRLLFVLFATLWLTLLCFGGCGSDKPSAAQTAAESLPFSVPSIFTPDEDGTARNQMLTFQSQNHTTLIVSRKDSTASFLSHIRKTKMTKEALVAAYKAGGLDVTVSNLHIKDLDDQYSLTYTVHLTTQNGSTITRKYIRITGKELLDISCGGNVTNKDLIDLEYTEVLQAVQQNS